MKLNLIKCHGSGNDFFILDETLIDQPLSEQDRVSISKLICQRSNKLGGSDGVLFYSEPVAANSEMRMFNPDGTEPEMCGNGIRCHGRYTFEKLGINPMKIKTAKATLEVSKTAEIYPGIPTYETEIEPVSFDPSTISTSFNKELFNSKIKGFYENMNFSAISVPNPHLIALVDKVEESLVIEVGKEANANPLFSEGINVSFMHQVSPNRLFVMTYERGVGLTNACGTAMSACTYIASKLNRVSFNEYIEICNKGGKVHCKAISSPKNLIYLKGNATYTNNYKIDLDLNLGQFLLESENSYTNEIENYNKLIT
ncbi:diaminopimelate epimerase [Candidatus Marinamargulisbacteria bacterium SCGC AAA071-K20]|nr:diaminopimelate epimerase [Candidatus Marinamargulisbacteria bacterium SCGC AAA071-K20]